MQDLAIGRVFRRLRQRRNWRQEEVAKRAGVSDSLYSEVERGHLSQITLGKLRRMGTVLEMEIALEPRWRGGALDRLLSARHADMSEAVTRLLFDAGWEVRPEVSFSHFGERGVVDLVAWHPESCTLLLVELKTEVVDVNDLLGVANRRRRLAPVIAASCGWSPARVAEWVVVAEGRTNRRRLADHRTVIRAAFPADGRAVPGWLRRPVGGLDAFWFLPDSTGSGVGRSRGPRLRVRSSPVSVDAHAMPANFRGLRNLADPTDAESS